jgi:hypothetical protein
LIGGGARLRVMLQSFLREAGGKSRDQQEKHK